MEGEEKELQLRWAPANALSVTATTKPRTKELDKLDLTDQETDFAVPEINLYITSNHHIPQEKLNKDLAH